MNPLRVRGENVGRFASFDVDLPAGRTAITGPNGSGKSTLLNAIELALFANGARDLGPTLGPLSDRGRLELDFEHDGQHYRVRREFGKKTTLDLEQRHPYPDFASGGTELAEEWRPLTRETTRETQAFLEQLLGLTRRTFRASSFLKQGDSAAFPDADPAERKAILGDALDPHGSWPRLAERARQDGRRCEQALDQLYSETTRLEERAGRLPFVRAELANLEAFEPVRRAAVADHEQRLKTVVEQLAALEARAERVAALRSTLTAAEQEHRRAAGELADARQAASELAAARDRLWQLQAAANRVAELEEKLEQQRAEVAELRALAERKLLATQRADEARAAYHALRAETLELAGKKDQLSIRIGDLRDHPGDDRCHVCEQAMGAEARQAAIRNLGVELAELERQLHEKGQATARAMNAASDALDAANAIATPGMPALEDIQRPLAAARTAAAGVQLAEHNLATLTAKAGRLAELDAAAARALAAFEEAQRELAHATAGSNDRARLENDRVDAARDVKAAQAELEGLVADLATTRRELAQLEADAEELQRLQHVRAERQADLDVFRLAEKAYGRDGIPTLVAENVIPTIEAGANDLLQQLPTEDGQTLRLELHTQRETQDGRLREELRIVVTDQDGQRPYETFSGGERARLNIALRVALARLLAGRRGAESRLLAIDELEFLDELGQEKLVELLRGLDGFDRILVVSHSPAVRDAFEQVIEIVKRDGVSRVAGETAAELEEAVA